MGSRGPKPTFDHQAAYTLRTQGLRYSEIATQLGVNKSAVRVAIQRHRARLQAPKPWWEVRA